MKNIIIILLFSFLCIFSYAQERFYNLYDGWCVKKIICTNDYYLSSGVTINPNSDVNTLQFNKIDLLGNLDSSITYMSDTIDEFSLYRAGAHFFTGDSLLLVGSFVINNKDYTLSPYMLKFDLSNMEVDNIKAYGYCLNGDAINYLLDTINEGFTFTCLYRYYSDNYFPAIIFTNSFGDTLSVKKYSFTLNAIRRMVTPYQLLKLPDGGFLMSCQDELGYADAYHAEIQRCCFLRIDSEGNELWRSYTTNTDTITFQPFAALMPDGDYLIAWSDPFLADILNPEGAIWLARMTDDGFIYGKKKVSSEITEIAPNRFYINDSYQDDSGNVYLTGERGGLPYPAFLLKVNSQGISEWYREYDCFPDDDAQATHTKIYGITPTEDGGFIMGGEYFCSPSTMFPSGTQQGLVIKVDSMGCLEEGCGTTNIRHTINAINAEIYPNPASEKITITLAEQTNAAHVKIYNAKGCLWINEEYENSEMDVSQLPAGVYTVNIWAEGKFYIGKFVKG